MQNLVKLINIARKGSQLHWTRENKVVNILSTLEDGLSSQKLGKDAAYGPDIDGSCL